MSPTPSDCSEGPSDMDSSSEHSASVRESSVNQSDVVDGEDSGDKYW